MTDSKLQAGKPHTATPQAPRQLHGARWLLAVVAMLCAGLANAQGIEISNAVFQQVETQAADGSTFMKTVPAVTVVPGGEVVYVVSYTNTGAQAATNLVITNPLPEQLVFVGAAPDSQQVSDFSVDGGNNYGQLAELRVTGEDGQPRAATAGDITHLRWVIDSLAPGAEGKVSYVARVK